MTQIIAISGRKQSGKTTLSNYLHGHEMKRFDVIEKFLMSPEGDLVVNYTTQEEDGTLTHGMGVLDLKQDSEQFYETASRRIWPLIKGYSFADALKELCVGLFEIPYECVYGTDDQKNMLQQHLRWENMPGVCDPEKMKDVLYDTSGNLDREELNPNWLNSSYGLNIIPHVAGPMTAREFMQFLGTDVMRKMYGPIWLNNTFKRIEADSPEIAVIGDCRFVNEIVAVQELGGKVVRLLRSPFESDHSSEVDADNYSKFDGVIDNRNITIDESCSTFEHLLVALGVTKAL